MTPATNEKRKQLLSLIAFDRTGDIERLIQRNTTYGEEVRQVRLDESIVWLDQLLGTGEPMRVWNTLGPMVAHDRLNAAYDYVVQMLFAYNRRWRTWKTREMTALLQLRWLPKKFREYLPTALGVSTQDIDGYNQRAEALRALFHETLAQLMEDAAYGKRPIAEAFVRTHDEPGRAWNMDDWNDKHRQLKIMRPLNANGLRGIVCE